MGIFVVFILLNCYNKCSVVSMCFFFRKETFMEHTNAKTLTTEIVTNQHVKDSGAKLIFKDPILCAEFLRGYVDVDILKDVQPEDIEDISERFIPMWQEERDSDSVKKIRIKDTSLFVIAIVEHQSKVHYDMSFRMLRYIVMVLTDYEAEQERLREGITKTKDFKYPPVIPIIYYEGSENWTAVCNFKDRVHLSDILSDYIPNFEYIVVPLRNYSNNDIIAKKDELSLVMLINKLKTSDEFKLLKDIPPEYLKNLENNTPEYLLKLISKIISVLLYRINIPQGEVESFTDQIMRREFSMLFDSFETYDVQAVRKESREEGKIENCIENILSLLEDFGTIPDELVTYLKQETCLDTLKKWHKFAAKAESIENFQSKIQKEN